MTRLLVILAVATCLCGAGQAVQTVRPNLDIDRGNWIDQQTVPDGGNLYTCINDVSQNADTNRIYTTGAGVSATDSCEVDLQDPTDPQSASGHIVRLWFRSSGSVPPVESLKVRILQGSTVISTSVAKANRNGSFTSGTYALLADTLTGAEADAITDYGNLKLRFIANGLDLVNEIDNVFVTMAELEVPNAPPSSALPNRRIKMLKGVG